MPLAFRVFLVSSLLGLGGCAANDTAVKDEQIVKTDLSETSGKVCKYTRVTGSKIPKMQCFTPDEIAQYEAAAKETLRGASRRGSGSPKDN